MPRRLLSTHTLTISRKLGDGYYDQVSGKYIETTDDFPAVGSIQPFRNGDEQINLPENINSEDVFFFFTKTEIQTADEFLERTADTTEWKGIPYECQRVEDWTGFGLRTDHYRCMFVRKDKGYAGQQP